MAEEKKSTTTKKTSTTKKAVPKKSSTTKKPTSSKATSSKTTTSKPKETSPKKTTSGSKGVQALKSVPPKKSTVSTRKKITPKKKKTTSKSVKTDNKSSNISSGGVKTTKKPTSRNTKSKGQGRVKKQSELTTLEVLEQVMEDNEIIEKEPLGKAVYLLIGIVAYVAAFFYIFNVVYNNGDYLQSAIFAFAAVFIMFVLMLFNIHKLVFNFFVLPFKRLIKQSRREIHKEIIFSVGGNKIQTAFNKYKSLFTLILYALIAGLLLFASIRGSIEQGDKVLSLITGALITFSLFLVVVCSWQYLFNILPSVLEKSIDAKNGFILTLSAAVMIIYVVFLILDITYLGEIMIFVLIVGFVALLGVNLNMIVGEINIFQNLRGRKNKAVTRVVFMIFFAFHIYVILYASVVAYSIYNWEQDSFVFSTFDYENVLYTELEDPFENELTTVYWDHDNDLLTDPIPLTTVYDKEHNEITTFMDDALNPVTHIYDITGNYIELYGENGQWANEAVLTDAEQAITCSPFYNDGTFACIVSEELPHTYGDFLYWTVVTVSTIGYGDVHPSTEYNIAMGWGGFLGIYGLTFFALSISFVSNIAMEGVNIVREEDEK